jgi:ACT domain-containing protein
LDISQTILQEYFTMMMLVDASKMTMTHKELVDTLNKKGQELGVSIIVQNEAVFKAMHRI